MGDLESAFLEAVNNNKSKDIAALLIDPNFMKISKVAFKEALESSIKSTATKIVADLLAHPKFLEISDGDLIFLFELAVLHNSKEIIELMTSNPRFSKISIKDFTTLFQKGVEGDNSALINALIECKRFEALPNDTFGEILMAAAQKRGGVGVVSALVNSSKFEQLPVWFLDKIFENVNDSAVIEVLNNNARFETISDEAVGIALLKATQAGDKSLLLAIFDSKVTPAPYYVLKAHTDATLNHNELAPIIRRVSALSDFTADRLGKALLVATEYNDPDVLPIIFQVPKSKDISTDSLMTAFSTATNSGYTEIAKLIRKHPKVQQVLKSK